MDGFLWFSVGLVACMLAFAVATIATLQPEPKGCPCDGMGKCPKGDQ